MRTRCDCWICWRARRRISSSTASARSTARNREGAVSSKRDSSGRSAADLRRQAEERLRREAPAPTVATSVEARRIAHELRVHKIELEIQNEELRDAQSELEATRDRYADLFDFAPVGYLTLNEGGVIETANLTVAGLLEVERGRLIGQPLSHFVHSADQDTYYLHRKRLFDAGEPQRCELRLAKASGDFFDARLDAALASSDGAAPVCRVVITDITERKRAED